MPGLEEARRGAEGQAPEIAFTADFAVAPQIASGGTRDPPEMFKDLLPP